LTFVEIKTKLCGPLQYVGQLYVIAQSTQRKHKALFQTAFWFCKIFQIMENREELVKKVNNVIDQVRPYLVADGGDIEFVSLSEDNVVLVELQGACASCSMSIMTLKAGVEQAMIKAIPEIKAVEAVNGL
jgi:Fe-S cluster biogenesis protein NfuA